MINASFYTTLAQYATNIPAFLLAFSIHEYAHAATAVFLGDPTPEEDGRVTLNPLVHIDPVGFIFLFIFGFGWGKPVAFNKNNFRYPRFFSLCTALAGPFSNFLTALVCLYAIKILMFVSLAKPVMLTLGHILGASVRINVLLGIFNLLPVPPLDGGHLITTLLVDRYPSAVEFIYRYSNILLLVLIFLSPHFTHFLSYLVMSMQQYLQSLVF